MASDGTGTGEGPGPRERRSTADQRRYNRRSPASDVSPPYYEVFDRIASALEGIERALPRAGTPSVDLRTEGPPRERLAAERSRSGSTPSAGPAPRSGGGPG